MEKLWRFEWESDYGNICGLFRATEEEVKNAIGKEIYLGEVEGKHSEVYGTLEQDEITLESDNPVAVNAINPIGINPLQYLNED